MKRFSVSSRDGTVIDCCEWGDGPGLVLLHGAMQGAPNFSKLAEALSVHFHVVVPNRRGRGQSGPHGPDYGLDKEVEDVSAILARTGARLLFGLSSGALIALAAAKALHPIDKLAVYEPPFTVEGADPAFWAPRFLKQLDRRHLASAMVTAIQGTGDVELFTHLPRAMLVPLMALAIRVDAARASADDTPIRALIPTVRYDVQIQKEATARFEDLSAEGCETLLMGGDKSHPALRISLDAFARRMPKAKRVELRGIGHLAADDTGRPLEVAQVLRGFFGSGS